MLSEPRVPKHTRSLFKQADNPGLSLTIAKGHEKGPLHKTFILNQNEGARNHHALGRQKPVHHNDLNVFQTSIN